MWNLSYWTEDREIYFTGPKTGKSILLDRIEGKLFYWTEDREINFTSCELFSPYIFSVVVNFNYFSHFLKIVHTSAQIITLNVKSRKKKDNCFFFKF